MARYAEAPETRQPRASSTTPVPLASWTVRSSSCRTATRTLTGTASRNENRAALALVAEQERHRDGDPRARGPGYQRQGLGETDQQGIAPADLGERALVRAGAIRYVEDTGEENRGHGNDHRLATGGRIHRDRAVSTIRMRAVGACSMRSPSAQ